MENQFVNGFQSYIETHFEVCRNLFYAGNLQARYYESKEGGGALAELAQQITDCFEKQNENREWDGEFWEEIDTYVADYLNKTFPLITVKVVKTPVTDRYCKPGDTVEIDCNTNKVRCGGAWFNFDRTKWEVELP